MYSSTNVPIASRAPFGNPSNIGLAPPSFPDEPLDVSLRSDPERPKEEYEGVRGEGEAGVHPEPGRVDADEPLRGWEWW